MASQKYYQLKGALAQYASQDEARRDVEEALRELKFEMERMRKTAKLLRQERS